MFIFKNLLSKTKIVRRVALFYILASLLNVWLSRRQLDSLSCFCIQSVTLPQVTESQENSTYNYMGMNVKRGDNIWSYHKNSFAWWTAEKS